MNDDQHAKFAYRLRRDLASTALTFDGVWKDFSRDYFISNYVLQEPLIRVALKNDKLNITLASEMKTNWPFLEKLFGEYAKMPDYEGISARFDDGTRLIF
jgi:hypothetical protein